MAGSGMAEEGVVATAAMTAAVMAVLIRAATPPTTTTGAAAVEAVAMTAIAIVSASFARSVGSRVTQHTSAGTAMKRRRRKKEVPM